MRVITFGPLATLPRSLTLPARVVTVRATTVKELELCVKESSSNLVVVDPSELRDDSFTALVSMIAAAGVPLMLYSTLNSLTAARALQASRLMPVEVVLKGAECENELLSDFFSAGGRQSVSALVLHGLSSRMAQLPEEIGARILAVFGGFRIVRSVTDFVRVLDLDETTLRKWLSKVGLTSPARILNCARVARSFPRVAARTERLDMVAEQVDWHVRTMRSQFIDLVGVAPLKAARIMKAGEVADRLIENARAGSRL